MNSPPSPSPLIPYEPIRQEYGIPVYSSNDIAMFGEPDHYGIWKVG